jgi:hypothetical protein
MAENPDGFELSPYRAGDVPLPPSHWKCRFDRVQFAQRGTGEWLTRELQCSSDEWRTSISDTATTAPGAAPVVARLGLGDGNWPVASVSLEPCTPASKCAPAPELP